jgi:integrase
MARKVRDSNLETRTARTRLGKRHKPYFRLIEPGLHLGYRKLASGPGTWLVRRYASSGTYVLKNLRTADGALVIADDYSDADGERILNFAQAQQKAKKLRVADKNEETGDWRTVGNAMDHYFQKLESDGRSEHLIHDARRRSAAFVVPKLGKIEVAALSTKRLKDWRDELVATAPRIRTAKAQEQKYRKLCVGSDATRARKATANRIFAVLRAALNNAFANGKVESDLAWRRVKPFKKVDGVRLRYLTIAEAKRLINASSPEFRPLVQAALQTGARYGELCALAVADFNSDVGTVTIRQSKSGTPRHIVLTNEGRTFFEDLTTGLAGDALMFRRQWKASHQLRPMAEAVKRAKIAPAITFHGLRHTWASQSIMNGMPLMVVAQNLGHSTTRMVELHYGHLSPSYITDEIRKSAPQFGYESNNVRAIC